MTDFMSRCHPYQAKLRHHFPGRHSPLCPCAVRAEPSALAQLDMIEQGAGPRLASCVVKPPTGESCAGIIAAQGAIRQEQL